MAVSVVDGRMFRNPLPAPIAPFPEVRHDNPDGEEVDPEIPPPVRNGEGRSVYGADTREIRLSTTGYPWRVFGGVIYDQSFDESDCSGFWSARATC